MAGRINWTRGLLRLWLILTLAWAGLMFLDERPDEQLRQYWSASSAIERAEALASEQSDPLTLPNGGLSTHAEVASDLIKLREIHTARWNRIIAYVQAVLVPSLLLLALGLMVGWAIRGFTGGGAK